MLRFDGMVAIVTGSGGGLGESHARLLAQRGAAVVVNDVSAGADGFRPAEQVVAAIIAAGGRAVESRDSVAVAPEAIVATALEAFGRLDIVVNNAGFSHPKPFGESSLDDIRRHHEVHFFGTAGVTLAAWPHLVASGAGRVVNTTSPTMYGIPNATAYISAKAAIYGFTRSAAIDGAGLGIKVNAIAPVAGTAAAVASDSTPEPVKAALRDTMPVTLVSPVVAYLAHPSCAISGETLFVAGGRVSRVPLGETDGFTDLALSPEVVADRIAEALDPATLRAVERLSMVQP